MSEVLTGLLKVAFSFIRSKAAEKLEDGGLTDQKFRGWIARELDEIKSKLDAISRKDLCTSISCLQEGIDRLSMSFAKSENPPTCEFPNAGASSSKKPADQIEEAVALANTKAELKIVSSERFELARRSFEEAGKEARRAFHNAALTTEERILASKVRVASGILQHLDDPEIAASDCLRYIEELHHVPALQEIFFVYAKAGLKSWIKSNFNKDSRVELVKTTLMINLILADFITKFTERRMAVFDWPTIKYGNRVVHPIHYDQTHVRKLEVKPPWDIVVPEKEIKLDYKHNRVCALTKKGDLVCFTDGRPYPQKLDKITGKLQPCSLSRREDHMPNNKVFDIVVDEDDTVYVLSGCNKNGFMLSVFSADGRHAHYHYLFFLRSLLGDLAKQLCYSHFSIAVNKDKNIVISSQPMITDDNITVYLCNSEGKLIHSFDTGMDNLNFTIHSSFVSRDNEIILVTLRETFTDIVFRQYPYMLHMFTKEGKLKRSVKFHPSNGARHYRSIFYNQITRNIICHVRNGYETLIEYLSDQTGELQCSYLLYHPNFPEQIWDFELVCHANGTIALVIGQYVIFLQKPSL